MTRDAVDAYVKAQTPAHQKIIQRLRRLVKKALPALSEELKWGNPCYILDGNENICCTYVVSNHVNLGFFRGVELKDPRKRLEGTGKAMRHIKVRDLSDIDDKVVTEFVRQASARRMKASKRESD